MEENGGHIHSSLVVFEWFNDENKDIFCNEKKQVIRNIMIGTMADTKHNEIGERSKEDMNLVIRDSESMLWVSWSKSLLDSRFPGV